MLSFFTGCAKVRGLFSPSAPENPHFVTISWIASKSPVAGYYVYREWQYSGPVRLTPKIVEGTQYVDGTVQAGRTYSYYVTSVDSKGLESKPSEKIWATMPTPPR
jgi:fibronectin type 3 domain-containing protein